MKPNTFLKTLTILHLSLCSALLLFAGFVFSQNGDFTANMDQEDIFIYVVPVIAAAGYFASKYIFQISLQKIKTGEALKEKLGKYQSATLVKYALLEGPAFLALFAYYDNGNALYLVIAIAIMAYLFVERPTVTKLIKELPLTLDEKKQFDTLNPS